jgi:hypothetical protein
MKEKHWDRIRKAKTEESAINIFWEINCGNMIDIKREWIHKLVNILTDKRQNSEVEKILGTINGS